MRCRQPIFFFFEISLIVLRLRCAYLRFVKFISWYASALFSLKVGSEYIDQTLRLVLARLSGHGMVGRVVLERCVCVGGVCLRRSLLPFFLICLRGCVFFFCRFVVCGLRRMDLSSAYGFCDAFLA